MAAIEACVFLKGSKTDSCTHPKLQRRINRLKITRDRKRGNELSDFRVRAGWTALSGNKVPAGVIVPLLRLAYTQSAGTGGH